MRSTQSGALLRHRPAAIPRAFWHWQSRRAVARFDIKQPSQRIAAVSRPFSPQEASWSLIWPPTRLVRDTGLSGLS